MSEVKPYKLPEEKTSMVSDSMAVRITPDTDIVTLRHNVMDAVYATTDQNALYSCLVFLSSQKQTLQSSVKKELLNRLDELSKLPDGWDGEGAVPNMFLMLFIFLSFLIKDELVCITIRVVNLTVGCRDGCRSDWHEIAVLHCYVIANQTAADRWQVYVNLCI